MTALFKQAPRVAGMDGAVELRRLPGETLILSVTRFNATQHVEMSEHNAAKVVVLLAFMIGLPISNKVLKAVKL
jgi:hypothetical protein